MITGVKLIGVCVRDQQRALDFFTRQLGFEVLSDVPMGPEARWIEVAPPGYPTHLALWTPPGLEDRIGTFSQVVFRCDDIQKTFRELREAGVTFTQEPKEQPGGTMGQFVDPDGNTFVLRG
jgi:lactoylglutathione lyase